MYTAIKDIQIYMCRDAETKTDIQRYTERQIDRNTKTESRVSERDRERERQR